MAKDKGRLISRRDVLIAVAASAVVGPARALPGERVARIGALYPLTGPSATSGRDARAGVELALDVVHGRVEVPWLPRLVNARLDYVFVDHQGKPEIGQAEAERLITQEKVAALQGAFHSSVVATSSQVAERLGLPYLCDIATSPSLHRRGFQWFFRTSPHDATFAENFFAFLDDLRTKRGVETRRVAIVTEDTLYGSDVAKIDLQLAREKGYDVVASFSYRANATDLSSEVLRLKAARPEVVFHAAYTTDAILFMKTYRQLDFMPKALIAHGSGFLDPAFRRAIGRDADYIFSWEIWGADLGVKKPVIRTVDELFRKRFGFDMTGHSARSFVGTIVMADAVSRARSLDPPSLRQALADTNLRGDQLATPWDGIRFDPATGQNVLASGIIVQLQRGEWKIIWPAKFATAEPLWPAPGWAERR